MNQAGRSQPVGVDEIGLERQAEVGRRDARRVLARVAGPDAVDQREAVGEPERCHGRRSGDAGASDGSHEGRGRHAARGCQAWPAGTLDVHGQTRSARRPRGRARGRPRPDQGRLAAPRPDQPPGPDRRRPGRVAGRDAADGRDQRRVRRARPARPAGRHGRPRQGPTRPRSSDGRRPASGRPAAAEADPAGHRPRRHERDVPAPQPGRRQQRRPDVPLRGQPPKRASASAREPPRASTPTGPLERDRVRHFRRPTAADAGGRARRHVIEFGKFHGHTLGQIAAFEPSYIDWVAGTVNARSRAGRRGARHPGRSRRRGVVRRRSPGAASARPARAAPEASTARPGTRDRPPDTGGRSIRMIAR